MGNVCGAIQSKRTGNGKRHVCVLRAVRPLFPAAKFAVPRREFLRRRAAKLRFERRGVECAADFVIHRRQRRGHGLGGGG